MNLYTALAAGRPFTDDVFATLEDGRRHTYADVDAASARFANALVALGVQPGDRVAVQAEKSIEAVTLYLGTVRAGAVFLPLNTAYTAAEVEYFLADAEPTVFVCDPSAADTLVTVAAKAGARLETLGVGARDAPVNGTLAEKAIAAASTFATVARGDGDFAAILYTSGTTGRSKGAMLTHGNLASNALTLAALWRFTARDVLIHALPIYHVHGLFVAINTVLAAHASMIFLARFDAGQVIDVFRAASALMGVPTFYTRLLAHPGLTREAAAGMRLFVSGSAPLLPETHRDFADRTGHQILERYGMTETGMNTSNPYDGARIAGTVGPPLPDVRVRITDPEAGTGLAPGEIGMIEVKGPNVFAGYWRMPEKTREGFRDGWFVTGDLGLIDERGYVRIVGRGKDLVITGGLNVYPIEVEAEIDALPGVVESAVIGLPHPDFGEGVTAVVAAKPGAALTEAGVIAALERRLARFKLPKRVLFVDDLPRNAMGKVQKAALREAHKGLYG